MIVQIEARNRIAQLREERGFTQSELARLANLPVQTVAAAEQPQREPRRSTAAAIAKALGVEPHEIYV